MHFIRKSWVAGLCLALSVGFAQAQPLNFLFASAGELPQLRDLLARPDIAGVQVVYNWKRLEQNPGQYDFSAIEDDLAYANQMNKKLFIQIQDRFFSPTAKNVPAYLMRDPQYKGGIVPQFDGDPGPGRVASQGWVAQQWNPAVQQRYQALLKALAAKFDGRVYGVNLPETAIDVTEQQDQNHYKTDFSCDRYFHAELQNALVARRAFTKSLVVQYVNFWPCEWNNDLHYMSRFFTFAAQHRIGVGGPDVMPNKPGQMKNSYPFFHQYKGKLPLVAMAIQDRYINPATKTLYSKEETVNFATDYLGANVLFWTPETPWLKK